MFGKKNKHTQQVTEKRRHKRHQSSEMIADMAGNKFSIMDHSSSGIRVKGSPPWPKVSVIALYTYRKLTQQHAAVLVWSTDDEAGYAFRKQQKTRTIDIPQRSKSYSGLQGSSIRKHLNLN